MPTEVGGLRLYVETTRPWAMEAAPATLPGVQKEVRFSAVPSGQPWGPPDLRFPILNYRWRAASYNNTWSALVPYNALCYSRGEDFGAIPDRLDVIAMTGGVVMASPVPWVQGSNGITLRAPSGLRVHYAHMNIETINPRLIMGAQVQAGQVMGQTGCTRNSARSQWADPHLHVGFALGDTLVSPYPFLVEAYLHDYGGDVILPVAGGYYFTTVGEPVKLDASRTVVHPGHTLASYTWRLHDGREVPGTIVQTAYDAPGQYAEELTVTTGDGAVARDFAQVRVYDPAVGLPVAFGWMYSWPVRGIHLGTPVLFWNRLQHTMGDVTLDYGDGWPPSVIEQDAWYTYRAPGVYTVTLQGHGPYGEPVTAKVCIVVT